MEEFLTVEQNVAIGQEDGELVVVKIQIKYNPAFIREALVNSLVDEASLMFANVLAGDLNQAEKESH